MKSDVSEVFEGKNYEKTPSQALIRKNNEKRFKSSTKKAKIMKNALGQGPISEKS